MYRMYQTLLGPSYQGDTEEGACSTQLHVIIMYRILSGRYKHRDRSKYQGTD
jgi:hypothetical protein